MSELATANCCERPVTATPETRDAERHVTPPVDIFESENGLTIVADLPGVDSADLDIRVEEGILTIKGAARPIRPVDGARGEYRLANFFRQFRLGDLVNSEKIQAKLHNGVLTLELPKADAAKPRTIKVNAG